MNLVLMQMQCKNLVLSDPRYFCCLVINFQSLVNCFRCYQLGNIFLPLKK